MFIENTNINYFLSAGDSPDVDAVSDVRLFDCSGHRSASPRIAPDAGDRTQVDASVQVRIFLLKIKYTNQGSNWKLSFYWNFNENNA